MARKISGTTKSRHHEAAAGKDTRLPSREDILRFVTDNPDRSAKRDIAKAFGIKGDDRTWLKQALRSLEDEGLIEKRRKKLVRPGALPPVALLDIVARDADGGLLAQPVETEAGTVRVRLKAGRSGKGPVPGIGDRVLARTFPAQEDGGVGYTGRVMKVLEKRRQSVLGILRTVKDGTLRVDPVERGKPEITIEPAARGDAQNGDLVEVEPLSSKRHGLPRGRVATVIGSLVGEKAISTIALHAHDIPHVFTEKVLAEAQAAGPATMKDHEDWRDLPLITIDPADAKDHDDAVLAMPDEDGKNPGGHIVIVAIADVAHYVRPGSALDREALRRGNSVYFPDRVVPMLPERISNDLCSLREKEDRPALAVRMVFSAGGGKVKHSFHRIMMRSAAKLSYAQAQVAIDGKPDDKAAPLLDAVLRPLWAAYESLKRGRDQRAPLELELPERKILLKRDGSVDRVVVPPRLDAHRLIEEFMIQANVAAAETLEARKHPLVYRVHEAPSLAKQEALREFLATLGLSLARGAQMKPGQFNGILERVAGTDHQELVNQVVLRSQSQAIYAQENLGHFGLNLRRYAHFTSPIRRYADLIVHRALIAALGLGAGGLTKDEEARLEENAALISVAERRAMAAERETVDRLIAGHLSGRIGEMFEGRVTGVTRAGLFVQLPEFGADGFIPVSTLGDDYYIHDEARHALVGERRRSGYQLGDPVEVRLVEVTPVAGGMRFEMATAPRPLESDRRSFHKARGRRTGRAATGRRRAGAKGGAR